MSAATLLTVLLLELALRLFLPQIEPEGWFQSNPRYGHVLKPNFYQRLRYPQVGIEIDVRTNSLGFRDYEYDLQQKNRFRVLLIGDSFTFGEGLNVDEIFATKLAVTLNHQSERAMVINTGVGGWGALQATLFARDHLDRYQPDVIVYTFCANDPDDDDEFLLGKKDNERGRLRFPGKIFLRNHSHLYRFVYYRVATLRHKLALRAKEQRDPSLTGDPLSGMLISDEQWSRTLVTIVAFGRAFHDWNPDGLFLVQATFPVNARTRAHLSMINNVPGARYVDLHDDVLQLGLKKVRLPYDGHWTPEMHALSARRLAVAIEESGVMDPARIPKAGRTGR